MVGFYLILSACGLKNQGKETGTDNANQIADNSNQKTSTINPNILNPNLVNPNLINPNLINPNLLNPNLLNPNLINPNILLKSLSVSELYQMKSGGPISLIDVREPDEYAASYIEGSQLIPLAQISAEKVKVYKQPIIIYCRSGNRSAQAVLKLLQEDPTLNLYSVTGGILAWTEAGYPTQSLEKKNYIISNTKQDLRQ
jgi:rhodanese-related sulfurtransferase